MISDRIRKYVSAAIATVAICACITLFLVSRKAAYSEVQRRPNILFIVIDTLRADHLGAYGYSRNVSPTMDAVAVEGVVFERPISQAPWTKPSMASVFCSQYPGIHKVKWIQKQKVTVFDDSFITFTELLRDSGYATAGFSANELLLRTNGFGQGFDHYTDINNRERKKEGKVRGDELNAEAIQWLQKLDPKKPFFVYLHYMDVHGQYYARDEFVRPLMKEVEAMGSKYELKASETKRIGSIGKWADPPVSDHYKQLPEYRKYWSSIDEQYSHLSNYREFWSALYDAGIREMDYHITALIDRLKEMGLWDETYVIITADHGEELCERGRWSHGWSLYDTELFVPLILRWPGVLPAGRRIGGTVRLIDLMPTLIEQLNLPKVDTPQGRSLVQDIAGQPPSETIMAFSEAVKARPNQWSVYYGDWKLIVDGRKKQSFLYNLAEDLVEQKNLVAKNPGKLKMLKDMLDEQVRINKELGAQVRNKEVLITPEQYQRLKSLGYIE
ncbi:sulfatase [Planctomycetota bacterium]